MQNILKETQIKQFLFDCLSDDQKREIDAVLTFSNRSKAPILKHDSLDDKKMVEIKFLIIAKDPIPCSETSKKEICKGKFIIFEHNIHDEKNCPLLNDLKEIGITVSRED